MSKEYKYFHILIFTYFHIPYFSYTRKKTRKITGVLESQLGYTEEKNNKRVVHKKLK